MQLGEGILRVGLSSVPCLWTLGVHHKTQTQVFHVKCQFFNIRKCLNQQTVVRSVLRPSIVSEGVRHELPTKHRSISVAVLSNSQNVPMWFNILGTTNRCSLYTKTLKCQGISPHMPSWSRWPRKTSDSVFPLNCGFRTLVVYFSRGPKRMS